jgi:hypothetical protein
LSCWDITGAWRVTSSSPYTASPNESVGDFERVAEWGGKVVSSPCSQQKVFGIPCGRYIALIACDARLVYDSFLVALVIKSDSNPPSDHSGGVQRMERLLRCSLLSNAATVAGRRRSQDSISSPHGMSIVQICRGSPLCALRGYLVLSSEAALGGSCPRSCALRSVECSGRSGGSPTSWSITAACPRA